MKKKRICAKMPILCILLFSTFFVFLNAYCTANSNGYGGDRTHYYVDFHGRTTDWEGINLLFSIIRGQTSDFHMVLYFTTFICCAMAFFAYRYSDDAVPNTLLFFFSTNFVTATFVNLKQCYVNALATIFFCLIVRPRSLKRNIICVFIAVLACYFHVTGYILFPIFIYFLFQEKGVKHIKVWSLLLLLGLIFFEPLITLVARQVSSFIPNLSNKIMEYFSTEKLQADEGTTLSFLKGMPYYLLLAWGVIRRKYLSIVVSNYGKYLVLTAIGVFFTLASAQSYWLIRFNTVFFFPMGILYSMLMKYMPKREGQIMSFFVIGGSFFFTVRTIILTFVNFGGI